MFYDIPLAYSTLLQNWNNLSNKGISLWSEYCLAYSNTIKLIIFQYTTNNTEKKENSYASLFSFANFIDTSNFEFNSVLRSKEFLNHFNKYFEIIVNLNSIQRQSFLIPLFSATDYAIDDTLAFLDAFVKLNETPYQVVQQIDSTRLLHYSNNESTIQYKTPLLLIYAPINRYHILDLNQERSIVRKFVSAGFDVFLLDWGERQIENRSTIADYIDYIDQSDEQIRKITKEEKVNLYGYSWAGTLSVVYTSLYNEKVKNLVLQSANLDFDKDDMVIAEWMRNFPAEEFVNEFGEMFGHFIDLAFLMRNPLIHSFDNIKYALETNQDFKFVENFMKIRAWINNTHDIPGDLFKQFVVDLYQNNLLIKGQFILKKKESDNNNNTKEINLKNIDIPVLNIVGTNDDLVSAQSSIPLSDAISSKDKRLIEFPSGHVELCIGADSHEYLWPQVIEWLKDRSS